MNCKRNGWDSTKRLKIPYFYCGPSTLFSALLNHLQENFVTLPIHVNYLHPNA